MGAIKTRYLLVARVLVIGLFASLTFTWWQQDDLYIHLQYVKNLLDSGIWAFNPGVPSYGTTSPLWILLVSVGSFPGFEPYLVSKILAVIFFLLTCLLILLVRDRFNHAFLFALCLIALLSDHWLRLSAGSGMEATLAAFIVTAIVIFIIQNKTETWQHHLILGMLSGLAILTRPELFFLPLALLFLHLSPFKDLFKKYSAYLFGLCCLVLPWAIYAEHSFGTIVPNTVVVKIVSSRGAFYFPAISALLSSSIRLIQFYGPLYFLEVLGILLFLGYVILKKRRNMWRDIPLTLFIITAAIPALYFLIQARGGEGISYCYAAPTLPALILVGFLAIDRVLSEINLKESHVKLVAALAVISIVGISVVFSILHTPSLKGSLYYEKNVLVEHAEWLKEHTDPSEIVACYDIGVIAYFADRQVLDMIGLTCPEIIPYKKKSLAEALAAFKPDYYVTPLVQNPEQIYRQLPPHHLVHEYPVTPYRFSLTSLAGKNQSAWHSALLKLNWDELQTAHAEIGAETDNPKVQ